MSDLLQNPVVPKSMSHAECVEAASNYLSKQCKVVLPEFYSYNKELPDVIGFNLGAVIDNGRYERREYSVLVECKVSRGDFLKDRKKSFNLTPVNNLRKPNI